jgi:hypothetical protein
MVIDMEAQVDALGDVVAAAKDLVPAYARIAIFLSTSISDADPGREFR